MTLAACDQFPCGMFSRLESHCIAHMPTLLPLYPASKTPCTVTIIYYDTAMNDTMANCDRALRQPFKFKSPFIQTPFWVSLGIVSPHINTSMPQYGAETWATTREQEARLEVNETRMLRWMYEVTRKDKIRNEHIRGTTRVVQASKKIAEKRPCEKNERGA